MLKDKTGQESIQNEAMSEYLTSTAKVQKRQLANSSYN